MCVRVCVCVRACVRVCQRTTYRSWFPPPTARVLGILALVAIPFPLNHLPDPGTLILINCPLCSFTCAVDNLGLFPKLKSILKRQGPLTSRGIRGMCQALEAILLEQITDLIWGALQPSQAESSWETVGLSGYEEKNSASYICTYTYIL